MKSNIVQKGDEATMQNMKMRNEMNYPVASIFMLALLFVYLAGFIKLRLWFHGYRFFGNFMSFLEFVACLLDVLLTVLVFMRKRNNVLFVALILRALYSVYSLIGSWVYVWEHISNIFNSYSATYVMEFICYLLLALESKATNSKNGKRSLISQMWFIPTVLSVIMLSLYPKNLLGYMNGGSIVAWGLRVNPARAHLYSDIVLVIQVLFVPMISTLSWWLTHPYKKENVVYQSPVVQPYVQRNDVPPTAFANTLAKVFCTNCGRELSPDEEFCGVCGTKRANVQPVFQQPIKTEEPVYQVPFTQPKVFCTECGRELSPDEEVCSVCGTKRVTSV